MDPLKTVHERAGDAPVQVGLILGSGLGHLADTIEGTAIPYSDLDGFPHAGVSGHNPKLVVGNLSGIRVAVLGGRAHYYESGDATVMRSPIRLLRDLGATQLILTNAAGSLRPDVGPGELMMLTDHINFSGRNPLIGEQQDTRFVNMTDAYDPEMRAALTKAAEAEDIRLETGVYAWYSGPSFETPAEIRAVRILGADAVGMSTVPEVILSRFYGIATAAISTITNMGAGMADETISHEQTKAVAPQGAAKLEKVLRRYLENLAKPA